MDMSHSNEKNLREAIRANDLGEGVEVSVGVGEPDYCFSNKYPSFNGIEVEVSSIKNEDESLLNKLSQGLR